MQVEAEVREAVALSVVVRSRDTEAASDLECNAKDFARVRSCETPTSKHIGFRCCVLEQKLSHVHSCH
jgi:hypothetical protein